MSKILSYNNKWTRSGSDDWVAIEPYSSDDIDRIKDPDGGLSEHPRTAIPRDCALTEHIPVHALFTWLSCTDHVADHALVT